MTREDVLKLFPEATDEQITNLLNQNNSEVAREKTKAGQYKAKADSADELQKKLDELEAGNLSEIEKANKALETANAKSQNLKRHRLLRIREAMQHPSLTFLLNRHHRLSRMTAVLTTKYSEKLSLIKRLLRHRLKSRKSQTEPQIRAVVVLAVVMELKVKVLKWQRNIISAM